MLKLIQTDFSGNFAGTYQPLYITVYTPRSESYTTRVYSNVDCVQVLTWISKVLLLQVPIK
jgi:hypothetical protein